ncbi:Gp19/Gp15/Gp42 family protein, partial [Enterococcus faecium]|uniref:Gp19/Gp15/Gp42 family protein n=1 Tax=Enterococcus faecium TaxID=1352 RepID=UPI003DA1CCC8
YGSVVKLVTVDIIIRVLRQSQDGDPMSQESQTALGYTWSGTYAIPGGGIAGAIMRNDLKRLGLRRQRYGVMDLWDGNHTECQ